MRNYTIFIILCILSSPLFVLSQHKPDSIASPISKLLGLSLEELMNIQVVTASGYMQTTSEAPSTITVITAKQIEERGYEQLEDALRDVPGIDMIHLNGYAPTLIYFRGMYGAENLRALLMIDGIAENNIIGTNDMAGPAYSLHNAERVEIIWGPASALYGANAFGGVINIITKKGGDMNGFNFQKGFGSFNTSFEKLSLGIKKSKLDFSIAATLYSTDGPKFTNRDPNYTASYVDKAYSFNGAIRYTGKNTITTLGYRTFKTPMGWGTFFNSPTIFLGLPSQGYGNQGILGLIARDVRGERSGLESPFLNTYYLQNEFNPVKQLNILGRVVYRETGTADNSYVYLTLDGRKLIRGIVANYSNRLSGELNANYVLSPKHRFSAGIQFSQDNVEKGGRKATLDTTNIYLIDGRDTLTNLNSTFLPRVYDIRNNFGSYLQYILNTDWLGKTNITVGLRYDYNSYFGNSVNPRISIVNEVSKQLSCKLQFGTAFRAPTNTEIYQTPLNVALKTEKIKTFEANIIYTFFKKYRLQLNGFRNELKDVILIGNLSGLTTDKNPGLITVNGIEAILDMSLTKNLSAFVNFTFQDANGRNLITNYYGKVPGVAKVKGNAGMTLLIENLFTLTLTGNWVGERGVPRTDPYGPVGGYFLANAVLGTRKLLNDRVTASLNIRNILNTQWLDPGFRTADGFLFSTVLEQPGINGFLKIGISL